MRRAACWLALAMLVTWTCAAAASAADGPGTPGVVPYQPGLATAAVPETDEELGAGSFGRQDWLAQIFGWGMIPIWACSVTLVALILDRRKALRTEHIIDPAMIDEVAELVGELKLEEARRVADESATVVGRAWAQGLHEFLLGGMSLSEALTNSTLLALSPLRRRLPAIATIGVISPLFGLLGTVLGMIITFGQIAATGGADKSDLAGGIGLALFTTAGGLIVAIPAILSNRYFTGRLTGIAEQAEEGISRVNFRHSHALARAAKEKADEDKAAEAAGTTKRRRTRKKA